MATIYGFAHNPTQNRTDLHLLLDKVQAEAKARTITRIITDHGSKVQLRICVRAYQTKGSEII